MDYKMNCRTFICIDLLPILDIIIGNGCDTGPGRSRKHKAMGNMYGAQKECTYYSMDWVPQLECTQQQFKRGQASGIL